MFWVLNNVLFIGTVGILAGGGKYARPYDSTAGLSTSSLLLVLIPFVVFILYVAIRVGISIRKEKRNKRNAADIN